MQTNIKRKIVSAVLYATTAFALWSFWDALFGMADEPFTHYQHWGFLSLSIAGTVLFVAACILTLFSGRTGTICALVAAVMSWPYFAVGMPSIPWGKIISVLPYANWKFLFTAILALLIASAYLVSRLTRGDNDGNPRHMGFKLTATFLYAASVVVTTMWREIWDWLFRLRYGT